MGGGGEREGMVDGGGGLRVGKKIENKFPGFGRTFTSYLVRVPKCVHFRTNMCNQSERMKGRYLCTHDFSTSTLPRRSLAHAKKN